MQHQSSNASGHKQLQLWYCADCSGVHLRTDHISLTFNNDEFAQLSKAVIEIYQNDIVESAVEEGPQQMRRDDILDSDLIA